MARDDNNRAESFRAHGWVHRLFRPTTDPRARLVVWLFVLGSAAHLWLADAWQLAWVPADVIYLLGLALLIAAPSAAGFALCALGLLVPLWFLRDQLTQSVFLLTVSLAGTVFLVWDAAAPTKAAKKVAADGFLLVVRGATILTYAFAALHKLNRDFFDARYSCAVYGFDKVERYWHLDAAATPVWMDGVLPFATLAVEVAIPLLLVARRRYAAWFVAAAFHIPLTLTMAPAFAFVMAIGHVAFVTPADRDAFVAALRSHYWWIAVAAAAATALSLYVHGAWPEVSMVPKEFLLWAVLLWIPLAYRGCADRGHGALFVHGTLRQRAGAAALGALFLAVYFVNGLTPYLGVQYQHAGAMLSNLRIDRGCWNSYVFDESVRLTDDYIRVEEAYFREPGMIEEYEQIVLEQLWSPPQLRQMRRNWCTENIRPFNMRGSFRGHEFVIEDLCDEERPLPFREAGMFGVEIFGDYLRFQKNLMKECPQECIH